VRVPSLSSLPLLIDETIPTMMITTTPMTTPQDHLFSMLPQGGNNNTPQRWTSRRMIPIIQSPPMARSGNPWGKWKNYSNNPHSTRKSKWDDTHHQSNRSATPSHDPATKPLTAFSTSQCTQQHTKR
jgi:hypothetical protein